MEKCHDGYIHTHPMPTLRHSKASTLTKWSSLIIRKVKVMGQMISGWPPAQTLQESPLNAHSRKLQGQGLWPSCPLTCFKEHLRPLLYLFLTAIHQTGILDCYLHFTERKHEVKKFSDFPNFINQQLSQYLIPSSFTITSLA